MSGHDVERTSTGARLKPTAEEAFDLLCRQDELTIPQIARRLGLERDAAAAHMKALSARKLAIVVRKASGRDAAVYARNPQVAYTVGIAFGRDRIRVAVADLSFGREQSEEESQEEMVRFPVAEKYEGAFDTAAAMVTRLLTRAEVDKSKVIGVGIALPGPMRKKDPVASRLILRKWVRVKPVDEMTRRLGLPVVVDNDANVAALGELTSGSARGSQQLIYILVTIGIGCGLIINGEVFRGADGAAGELGHMIIDPNRARCPICKNKGCADCLLGGRAIAKRLRARLRNGNEGSQDPLTFVIEQAKKNDKQCQDLITDMGRQLGMLLANLCTLLNPERVIIGGRIAGAGNLILTPITEAVGDHAFGVAGAPEVTLGALRERAVVRGALALVLRPGDDDTYGRLHTLLPRFGRRN